jgi:hypothetical protein
VGPPTARTGISYLIMYPLHLGYGEQQAVDFLEGRDDRESDIKSRSRSKRGRPPPQAALPDAVMAPQSSIQITVLALETVMYPKKPLPRSLLGSESMTGRQA